jgi:hypothetical protein
MSNDIEKKKPTDLASDQKNVFEAYGDAATARAIEGDLLKFVQGDYFAGQDNREIPLGTKLVARMDTLAIGWLRWQDNAPGDDERIGLVAQGFMPVKRHELGDLDKACWETDKEGRPRDPWQFTNRLVLHGAEDAEVVFTFATSSRGGLDAVGELCKAYGRHIRQFPDEDPIIELDGSSYPHPDKTIGRVKYPIFKVVGWVKKNGLDDAGTAPTEPPKSPPSDKAAGAAAKPATTHKPAAPHF